MLAESKNLKIIYIFMLCNYLYDSLNVIFKVFYKYLNSHTHIFCSHLEFKISQNWLQEKNTKKGGQVGVALLDSRLQVCHCIMDSIKFEFNDIISLYKKNDPERRRYVSLGIRHIIYISMV